MRLWDATTGKEVRKMTGHSYEVVGVAFGPAGQAISGGGGTMRLWDLHRGKTVRVFHHSGNVGTVAYSARAGLAASGSMVDQSLRLWNLGTGKEVRRITTTREYFNIMSVCFSPDGKHLLVTDEHPDATLSIRDVGSAKELKAIQGHKSRVRSSTYSPDGKRIVSGSEDGLVRLWDAETGNELRTYKGHTGAVYCVVFFPDGKRIASASHDGTGRIWGVPK